QETFVWRQLDLRSEADLKQDFALVRPLDPNLYKSPTNLVNLEDKAVMHFHMSEVVEFYKDFLKADIDYKLPVNVVTHQTAESTQYSPTTATIYIHMDDSDLADRNKPKNREWHEFSHHVMYSMYRQWPGPTRAPWDRNHNGYANPSTGDSFTEGFAEFMPLVIAEHYHYPSPAVYPVGGSLEQNWRAWSRRGFYEELAVAGVLWDIYDVGVEGDDVLQMKFEDIWTVLKSYSKDFTEVYEEFGKKYPANKELFKKIWISHGFFVENQTGNGRHDGDEPFEDLNSNYVKNAGEPHIDLADNGTNRKMVYDGYEKVGPASNYLRLNRRNSVMDPAGNVKVDNNIPGYKVVVKFADHPEWDYEMTVDNNNGMINVPVPDEEYEATVTVTPDGVSSSKPLVITTEEFAGKLEESAERGYYVEHDFGVKDVEVAEKVEENVRTGKDVAYWEYHEQAKPGDYEYKEPKDTGWDETKAAAAGGGSTLTWIIILAIAVIIVSAYLLVKKGKKKGHARKK
ncbi:hypothetical protein JW711_06670, partial [Candidatus Woesearchaeota archaeon]|nr:hypothetical protein [Candidatus Woesearchaeota archaeon]